MVEGIGKRVKLRLRRYEGSARIRIEKKHRSGRTRRKERAWTSRSEVDATRAAPFEASAALRPFAARLAVERPVVAVRYERTALVGTIDPTLRVTLDEGLRGGPPGLFWRGANSDDPRLLPPGRAVLEIKHRGLLPGFLARLARAHEVRLSSASKYRWGIERGGVRREVSARG
ncbi:VTC domain-containing protein [bacterium AH-315-N03]|nr:VTC domain-containing protein [bacterium AH-315-N03]